MSGINCPRCGSNKTQVLNRYDPKRTKGVRRNRHCMACDERFNTLEDYDRKTMREVEKMRMEESENENDSKNDDKSL